MDVSSVDVQAMSLDEKNALWDLFNEEGIGYETVSKMELFFAKLKRVFQEDINATVTEYENELVDMEDDHDQRMDDKDSVHEQEVDDLIDEIARLKTRVAELEQE